MANFCPQCGKPVKADAAFCAFCGAPLGGAAPQQTPPVQQPVQQPVYQVPQYQQPQYAGNGQVRLGIPAPGFSDRINDPEVLAALKLSKKKGRKFTFIFLLLPIIGFAIYGALGSEIDVGQGLIYGGIVSVIMLVLMVYNSIKERAGNGYDATVIDKYTRTVTSDDDEEDESITVVRTTRGKKIKLKDDSAWDYLPMGAQFRYHPNFAFPYELYDKSRARKLYCPACRKANPVEADRCERCNVPLIK